MTASQQTMIRLFTGSPAGTVEEWTSTAVPLVQGLQVAVGSLAGGYMVSQLRVMDPSIGLAARVDLGEQLVNPSTPWLRAPVLRERKLIAEGLDPVAARSQAARYAGDLMVAEVRATERVAAADSYRKHWDSGEPLKYKRILEVGACGWCKIIADRLYSADDEGDWHTHCHCIWRTVTPAEAGAHSPKYSKDQWRDVIDERSTASE
jgi:hypothetical protein